MTDPREAVAILREKYISKLATVQRARTAAVMCEGAVRAIDKTGREVVEKAKQDAAEAKGLMTALAALEYNPEEDPSFDETLALAEKQSEAYGGLIRQLTIFSGGEVPGEQTPPKAPPAPKLNADAHQPGSRFDQGGTVDTEGRVPSSTDAVEGVTAKEARDRPSGNPEQGEGLSGEGVDNTKDEDKLAVEAEAKAAMKRALSGTHEIPTDEEGRALPAAAQMTLDSEEVDQHATPRESGDGEPGVTTS